MHETAAGGTASEVVVCPGGLLGTLAADGGAEVFAVGALGEHGTDHGRLDALESLGCYISGIGSGLFLDHGRRRLVDYGLRPEGAVVMCVKGTCGGQGERKLIRMSIEKTNSKTQ